MGRRFDFTAKEVRASGRSAKGVRGIRLGKGDEVIGALVIQVDVKARSRPFDYQ